MAKIQDTNKISCWKDVEQQEISCIAGGNTKTYKDTLEGNLEVSCKDRQSHNIHQSHSMVFIPMSLKTFIHTKACTQIFKASLFILFKT